MLLLLAQRLPLQELLDLHDRFLGIGFSLLLGLLLGLFLQACAAAAASLPRQFAPAFCGFSLSFLLVQTILALLCCYCTIVRQQSSRASSFFASPR